MTLRRIFFCFMLVIYSLTLVTSCATTSRVPTLSFTQYGMDPGPSQTEIESDIEITVTTVRISDIYDYPNIFSFNLEEFPQYRDNFFLNRNYPIGPLGKQWFYPFASPDASQQLLIAMVKIENGTNHILRMEDARVYLIIEGLEPVPALSSYEDLQHHAGRFESMEKQQWESKLLKVGEYPVGFTRAFLQSKRNHYKLINDVSKEMLPGFNYKGMLVFPVIPSAYGPARISFFDITTKTDAVGNPVEKVQFNFTLEQQAVSLWYDKAENRWKRGFPPVQPKR